MQHCNTLPKMVAFLQPSGGCRCDAAGKVAG
jgi:hypothetical protein